MQTSQATKAYRLEFQTRRLVQPKKMLFFRTLWTWMTKTLMFYGTTGTLVCVKLLTHLFLRCTVKTKTLLLGLILKLFILWREKNVLGLSFKKLATSRTGVNFDPCVSNPNPWSKVSVLILSSKLEPHSETTQSGFGLFTRLKTLVKFLIQLHTIIPPPAFRLNKPVSSTNIFTVFSEKRFSWHCLYIW